VSETGLTVPVPQLESGLVAYLLQRIATLNHPLHQPNAMNGIEGMRYAMAQPFRDRADAGRQLAGQLPHYANRQDVIVLGLPRGGVPVAYEIAMALQAPLDVFVVRKIGVPGHEELALGALASGGIRVFNEDIRDGLPAPEKVLDELTAREQRELERREQDYRGDQPPCDLANKTVILVDDGVATGASMRAATAALRRHNPQFLVGAVPVAAPRTCDELCLLVDEMVCAATPQPFSAVGAWYRNFTQTSDTEVRDLLERARTQPQQQEAR
jgi:putative phosphoribosyl transferase